MLPSIRTATCTPYLLAPYSLSSEAAIHHMREAIRMRRAATLKRIAYNLLAGLAAGGLIGGAIIIALACTNY